MAQVIGIPSALPADVLTLAHAGVLLPSFPWCPQEEWPQDCPPAQQGHLASLTKTRGFHTQLDEGPETP